MTDAPAILVLGIGNVLMGDEGVGVAVVRHLADEPLPNGVDCLDGGTGSFQLIGPMQEAGRVVLVDATLDGREPGRFRRLRPRFSTDYPRTLTAHDIGLKDLLDTFYLLGEPPDVTLFAISIQPPQGLGLELTAPVRACVPAVAAAIREDVGAAAVPAGRS